MTYVVINPPVSVIVTAHNRKEFLRDAIQSVLDQTLDRSYFEIVVVKNFVDDEIDALIEKEGIRNIFLQSSIMGDKLVAGLENTSGRIVVFLDDDDRFHKKKLETILQIFEEDKSIGYYHNSIFTTDSKGEVINESFLKNPREKIVVSDPQAQLELLLKAIKCGADYNTSSMVIDRNIIVNNEDRLKDIKAITDSFVFYSALMSGKKIIVDSEKLTYYRVHNSTSNIIGNIDIFLKESKILYEKYVHDYTIISDMTSKKIFSRFAYCNLKERSAVLTIIDPTYKRDAHPVSALSLLNCAISQKNYGLLKLLPIISLNTLSKSTAQSLLHRHRVRYLKRFNSF